MCVYNFATNQFDRYSYDINDYKGGDKVGKLQYVFEGKQKESVKARTAMEKFNWSGLGSSSQIDYLIGSIIQGTYTVEGTCYVDGNVQQYQKKHEIE